MLVELEVISPNLGAAEVDSPNLGAAEVDSPNLNKEFADSSVFLVSPNLNGVAADSSDFLVSPNLNGVAAGGGIGVGSAGFAGPANELKVLKKEDVDNEGAEDSSGFLASDVAFI